MNFEHTSSRRQFLRTTTTAAMFVGLNGFAGELPWERRFFDDPETGVKIIQATSFPTVNMNMYFRSRCWTPDAQTFLFWSMTQPKRNGRMDLYRVNVDGTQLVQLTEGKSLGDAALHPGGGLVYFTSDDSVYTLDINSLAEKQVVAIKGATPTDGIGSFTNDGRRYCFNARTPDNKPAIGFLDTLSKQVRLVPKSFDCPTFVQIEPKDGHYFHYIGERNAQGFDLFVTDEEGQVEQIVPILHGNGHGAWLGPSGRMYSAISGDLRGIMVAKPGEAQSTLLAAGPPNFWHPGCDPDGKWMVSDSNAPDDGLQLICVETGRFCRLAFSASNHGHAQWSHPHPSVSPDAQFVVFNSTRTGVPHVYVATIPSEMKGKLQIPFQPHKQG